MKIPPWNEAALVLFTATVAGIPIFLSAKWQQFQERWDSDWLAVAEFSALQAIVVAAGFFIGRLTSRANAPRHIVRWTVFGNGRCIFHFKSR